MKFSIDKETLLNSLQLLSKATPTRSTLPIIGSALFSIKENLLSLRTTDLEISIKINLQIDSSEEGAIAIPLSKLLDISNVLPKNKITFFISDIGKVNIVCDTGEYTIMGQSVEEFPNEASIENSQDLIISSKELNDIILNTAYATSKDDLKPVLQGVLFEIEKEGIVTVATDGHRLVKLQKQNISGLKYSGKIIVPTKFLSLINSLLKKDENVCFLVSENHLQANINDIIITTRIINESYPDYEGVIPKENTNTLIINKKIFFDAIKRISIFSNKASRQIALEINQNHITITTEDPENITTGKEKVECEYDGEPMTIGYNALYLKEVVQHQSSEEIKILLNTPLNAGLFLPIEQSKDSNKTTLLMPIRLN